MRSRKSTLNKEGRNGVNWAKKKVEQYATKDTKNC